MAAGAAYVEELSAYSAGAISAACRQWVRGQARWPALSELLEQVESVEAEAQRKPVEDKQAAWQVYAEAAVGTLANCFIDRIRQLDPEEHDRFGRELAEFAMQFKLMEIPEHGGSIRPWVEHWLGATWSQLMGQPPEPIDHKGSWKRPSPPMPDMTGRQRVVVEPEGMPA